MAMDDMDDLKLWAQCSWWYEQLRVVDDMNDSRSWAQCTKCYESLKVVDDMNDLTSREIKPLDAIDSSGLWMLWIILSHELMTLDAMNSLGLWNTETTMGH